MPDCILCTDCARKVVTRSDHRCEKDATHHLLSRKEEVADGGGEVIQTVSPKQAHFLTNRTQEPEIIVDGHEIQGEESTRALDSLVGRKNLEQVGLL